MNLQHFVPASAAVLRGIMSRALYTGIHAGLNVVLNLPCAGAV